MHERKQRSRGTNVNINLNVIINLGGAFDGIVETIKKLLKR